MRAGKSHLWHKKYSLPYTIVLGFVLCRSTSKNLNIGSIERSWGDAKEIKSGKRSNLSAKSVEMRVILYTSTRVGEARIKRVGTEKMDAPGGSGMYCNNDMK